VDIRVFQTYQMTLSLAVMIHKWLRLGIFERQLLSRKAMPTLDENDKRRNNALNDVTRLSCPVSRWAKDGHDW
jgi:hypothetical protein